MTPLNKFAFVLLLALAYPLTCACADEEDTLAANLSHQSFAVRQSAAMALAERPTLRAETIARLVAAMEASVLKIQISPAATLDAEAEEQNLALLLALVSMHAPEHPKFIYRIIRLTTGTTGASTGTGRLLLEEAAMECEKHLSEVAKYHPNALLTFSENAQPTHRLAAITALAHADQKSPAVLNAVLRSYAEFLAPLPRTSLKATDVEALGRGIGKLGSKALSLAPQIRQILRRPESAAALSEEPLSGNPQTAQNVYTLAEVLVRIDPTHAETLSAIQNLHGAAIRGDREPEIEAMLSLIRQVRAALRKKAASDACSDTIVGETDEGYGFRPSLN